MLLGHRTSQTGELLAPSPHQLAGLWRRPKVFIYSRNTAIINCSLMSCSLQGNQKTTGLSLSVPFFPTPSPPLPATLKEQLSNAHKKSGGRRRRWRESMASSRPARNVRVSRPPKCQLNIIISIFGDFYLKGLPMAPSAAVAFGMA